MNVFDRRWPAGLLAAGCSLLAFAAVAAAAGTPADKCEATKLRETGKLAACLTKSYAKSAQNGLGPDQESLDACGTKFETKLGKAEEKADETCPTTEDAAGLRDAVEALAEGVKDSVSGVRFIDNGDGTVTDTEQGVLWQKSTAGTGSLSSIDEVRSASDFLAHLGSLNGSAAVPGLGGRNDWGLPTLSQLQSILDCSTPPCHFISPLLGPDPTPASVGSTYLLTGETSTLPLSTLPCVRLIIMEDGSVECKDLPSAEGRSKVRTQNNAR